MELTLHKRRARMNISGYASGPGNAAADLARRPAVQVNALYKTVKSADPSSSGPRYNRRQIWKRLNLHTGSGCGRTNSQRVLGEELKEQQIPVECRVVSLPQQFLKKTKRTSFSGSHPFFASIISINYS